MLRWLAAAPIGAALSGCSQALAGLDASSGQDAGTPDDAGNAGDAGADAGVCEPTESDALGPFYESGSPMRMMIAGPSEPGDRLLVEGRLVDLADCSLPLAGYLIDIWQADMVGNYYTAGTSDYRLRGRIVTGGDGRFAFETIKPGYYETTTGPRPAHFHVRVYDPFGLDRLITQIYFEGDPFLGPADGCQPPTCNSDDPARVLSLTPARVGGQDGFSTRLRLVTPR